MVDAATEDELEPAEVLIADVEVTLTMEEMEEAAVALAEAEELQPRPTKAHMSRFLLAAVAVVG